MKLICLLLATYFNKIQVLCTKLNSEDRFSRDKVPFISTNPVNDCCCSCHKMFSQKKLFIFQIILIINCTRCSYLNTLRIFSAHLSRRLTGELIVYPWIWHPSLRSHFQTSSPLKPLGQSKPNFKWSLLGKGERKFL